jgi:hypothetical protein
LDEAQRHEQDRREDARLLVSGQQPDGKGGEAHHHERRDEHRLPPDLVAIVPKDHATERPGEKAHRIGAKRSHRGRERIQRGKEQLPKHQRRGGAVEEEVIPFDRRADEARQHDPGRAVFRPG